MIREVLTMGRLRAMPPDEAAALWTVRLAEGEQPHERDLFEEWLDLAPANRDAWARAQRGWNLFDAAQGDELLDEMRRHARAAGAAVHQPWKRFAAAAALVLVVVSGSMVAERSGILGGVDRSSNTGSANRPPLVAASYTYASGQELPKLITLPDGSRMTLDAQSRVTAAFGRDRRSLEVVSGRAFFDVRHDPSRPFAVRAGNLQVVDIGTKFEVERARQSVEILLVEGRLSVTAPASPAPLTMSAGERLTAVGSARPVLTKSAADAAIDWQQGFATFDDSSLSDAAAVLNRYPGKTLIVRDPRVANLRISGMFRMGDTERFGRTVEQVHPVRMVRRGDRLEIVPAG